VDPVLHDERNEDVQPARGGEFEPLLLGPLEIWPPVVLAPMAGVTSHPFRRICRRFGAGLCVSEMITARPLVTGNRKTLKLAAFGDGEKPRSLQLYGTDPHYVGEAVRRLTGEGHVDHIDMNFGCPVRKVTSRGGGAAIPVKPKLLRGIIRAAVSSAGGVPVTIKVRLGIDDEHLTHLSSGRIAEDEGCAAIALHARTAAQLYDGAARWEAIAELKQSVHSIPVLGNGDIWEGEDALRMMRTTGCDGVVVGRGCLGRPWIFRDLAQLFEGRECPDQPNLGEVVDIMLEHVGALADWFGPSVGVRLFRRHAGWYTKGFHGSTALRRRLMGCATVPELAAVLEEVDRDEPFPESVMRIPRGKTAGTQKVVLPPGYLDGLADGGPDADAACAPGEGD
jgi:nifR3 family TIM-barrel protein